MEKIVKNLSAILLILLGLARLALAQEDADTSKIAKSGQDIRVLEPNKWIERELTGVETHAYQVMLAKSQSLHVIVDPCGIEVVVTLFEPNGNPFTEVNHLGAKQRRKSVLMEAQTAGIYRLEVHARERKEASKGSYRLTIEMLKEASSQDPVHVAAERAWAAGVRLYAHQNADSLREAIAKFEKAIPLWQAVEDRRQEAKALHTIGYVYRLLGEKQVALDYFKQALQLRRAERDSGGEAAELNDIGWLYGSWGKYQNALEYYHQALSLSQAVGARSGKITALLNIGAVYRNLGEYQMALAYYRQALPLCRIADERRGEATTLHNIGDIYRYWNEYQRAREYYTQALQLKQCTGDRRGEANVLQSLGMIHYALDEHQKALDYYDQALALARFVGNHVGEANALHGIGCVYKNWGKSQKALDSLSQALSLWRALEDRSGEATTLYEIARVEHNRGNLNAARAHIESALAIIESLRTEVMSAEWRASYLASMQNHYEFYLALLMQLHRLHPLEGHDATAFQVSERARARTLLETLIEVRADLRQGVDSALVERERTLQHQLNTGAEQLTRLLGGNHKEQQALASRKALEALLTEYQEVRARIKISSPRYAALTQPQPLTLNEIQQQVLDDETILLEYAMGEKRSFLWAVTPTTFTSLELPARAQIDSLARRVYKLLTARNQRVPNETLQKRQARMARADEEYHQAAAALSQAVLGPVADQLETKRLLIVSDGVLQYIPYGALPTPVISKQSSVIREKKALNTDHWSPMTDYRPLMVDHEIISLPSASVLFVLRREVAERKPAKKAVVVLADPVFDRNDSRVMASAGQSVKKNEAQSTDVAVANVAELQLERALRETGVMNEGLSFERLYLTREEAKAIMKYAGKEKGMFALDFKASRLRAKSPELSQYRIVHFATHGLLNSTHPELSGLVLSLVDSTGVPQDGFLRLHEIYNLHLPAELVVLSACQTALGKDIRGEGLVGLTRGFMYAGAARVVASLWSVDDIATAKLMQRFYQKLLGAQPMRPAGALRAAQIEMWETKGWNAPYYWAAFVLQGEWR